jgi:hypothetical protein
MLPPDMIWDDVNIRVISPVALCKCQPCKLTLNKPEKHRLLVCLSNLLKQKLLLVESLYKCHWSSGMKVSTEFDDFDFLSNSVVHFDRTQHHVPAVYIPVQRRYNSGFSTDVPVRPFRREQECLC